MNDAFSEIKKILSESDEGYAKKKQEENASSAHSSGSASPDQKGKEVLKAPGVDEVKAAGNATGKATHPMNDSKAKSSSSKVTLNQEEKEPDEKKKVLTEPEDEKKKKDDDDEDENDSDEKSEKKEKKENPFKKNKDDVKEETFDVDRHIQAMFNDENSLSEDFKGKAKTIFEAALSEREQALRASLEEEYNTLLQSSINEAKEELTEQVDAYLDYIAENWLEENRVAVETGLRLEITESLVESIRNVFLEHNISVPESKVDLVEELAAKVEELQDKLNDEINKNIELSNTVDEYRRSEVIAGLGEDLSSTQFDKFLTLAENVKADSEEELKSKLEVIKESYFKKSESKNTQASSKEVKKVLSEGKVVDELEPSTNNEELTEEVSPTIEAYVNILSRSKK